jgi:imidazolonepropionase-like amidohydrolase
LLDPSQEASKSLSGASQSAGLCRFAVSLVGIFLGDVLIKSYYCEGVEQWGSYVATLIRKLVSAMAFVVVFSVSTAAQEPLVLTNATLIDALSSDTRESQAVTIDDGRIVSIVPMEGFIAPENATIMDLSGRFVVPGYIDTHVHLSGGEGRAWTEAMLNFFVHSGITTVRDMAGDVRYLADIRRASVVNEIASPDVHFSSLMAGPSFFDDPRTHQAAAGETPGQAVWMLGVDDDTDVSRSVARASGTGATGIKIYANLPGYLVQQITREAHAQDMQVWTHATVAPALPADTVGASVDSVSHACMLVSHISPLHPQAYPARPDQDFGVFGDDVSGYADLFTQMVANEVTLDATMFIYERARRAHEADPENPPRLRCPISYAGLIVAAAHEAGVAVTTGTDGYVGDEASFPALFDEFELLAEHAGFSPHDVLTAATINGAMAMGLADETGTIEVGKRADLVVLSENPLSRVANLRMIDLTIREGRVYVRDEYIASPALASSE